MTLVELARRLDTHASNVKRWETNRVSPRWETVVRIASALEVPVEDLAAGEDSSTRSLRQSSARLSEEPMMLSLSSTVQGDSDFSAARFHYSDEEEQGDRLHAQTMQIADTHERRAAEYRNLSRFLRHPRFRALRTAIAQLPEDLSQEETRKLAEVVETFLQGRGDE